MTSYQRTKGYDPLIYYTRLELREMFRAEGYSTKEATREAQALYWEIRKINDREGYSWHKARELELSYGKGRALEKLGAHYGDAEDIWDEVKRMAQPDERDRAHYERLRGQCMRIKAKQSGAPPGTLIGSQGHEEPGEPVPT